MLPAAQAAQASSMSKNITLTEEREMAKEPEETDNLQKTKDEKSAMKKRRKHYLKRRMAAMGG